MSRYFRLMALAMCDILFTTPLAIFNIWLNVTLAPMGPWVSWEDTHFDYGRVVRYPAILWRRSHILVISVESTRWAAPLCAIVFFAFFGLADEAKKNYHLAFYWVMKHARRAIPSFPVKREKFPGFVHLDFPYPLHVTEFLFFRGHKILSSTGSESSTLPMYSPPPSSPYQVFDIKRPDSFNGQQDTPTYSLPEKAVENDTTAYDPTHDSHMYTSSTLKSETNGNRFSWKSVSVPFASRRHSSYF